VSDKLFTDLKSDFVNNANIKYDNRLINDIEETSYKNKFLFVKLREEYLKIIKIANYDTFQDKLYGKKNRKEIVEFELFRIKSNNLIIDYVKENIVDIEKLLKMYDEQIPDEIYEKMINLIIKLELSLDMNVGLFREVCRLYEKENKLFNEGLTRIRV
jgi:hypothetical protein